jgi:hypothetical protein
LIPRRRAAKLWSCRSFFRNDDVMAKSPVWTECDGEEETSSVCPCCNRPIHEGEGVLCSDAGDLADYGYQWSEGHEARFTLGVAPLDAQGKRHLGIAVVACRSEGGSLVYTVLDPEDAPWQESDAFGPILGRKELLDDKRMPGLFDLVDAIAAHEPRIATRILGIFEA